jgi:hypothetical protein
MGTRLSAALFDKELKEHERRVPAAEERWGRLAEKERQRNRKSQPENPINFGKILTRRIRSVLAEVCRPKFLRQVDRTQAMFPDGPPSLWSRQLNPSAPWQLRCMATIKRSSPRFIPWLTAHIDADAFLQNLAREFHGKVQENSRSQIL